MGIQVAIQTQDDSSGTGFRKVHGPTRPKGQGHTKDPYLGFPDHARPWRGSVTDGLVALARWLADKPALQRQGDRLHVYVIRSPEDVRGRRAKRRAQRYLEEGS